MKDLNQLRIVLSDLTFINSMAQPGEAAIAPGHLRDLLKAPIADLAEYIEREGK